MEVRLQDLENQAAVGTDWSHRAVSNLDFELRKVREFQKSSRGVRDKSLTPPSRRPNFLGPSG